MAQEIKAETWDGKPFVADIISLAGEVAKINRTVSTQTNVTGGGGTVSSNPTPIYTHPAHAGFNRTNVKIDPVKVSTTTTLHDDVFLIDKNGKEHLIQFKNRQELGIRDGHQIQLLSIRGDRDGKEIYLPHIAIKNISLDKEFYENDKAIKIVSGYATYPTIMMHIYQTLPPPQKIALLIYIAILIATVAFMHLGTSAVLLFILVVFSIIKLGKVGNNNEKIYKTQVLPALKDAML